VGRRVFGWVVWGLLSLGCSKKATSETSAAPSLAPAPVASTPVLPTTGGFECLVGKWKSVKVTLAMDPVTAEGGANVLLDVGATGASTLDFSSMEEVKAAMPAFKFDFRYSGKATGTLVSPSPGTLESSNAEWSGLRVTATANVPGLGKMPLLKDTPVSQLAAMGTALGGALASAEPAAPAGPAAPQGIDASPVLSSSRYTCTPDTLTLSPKDAKGATWVFAKQPS